MTPKYKCELGADGREHPRRGAGPAKRPAPACRRPGVCRVCQCTDADCTLCVERTGDPCHWVEPDLCSACAPGDKAARDAFREWKDEYDAMTLGPGVVAKRKRERAKAAARRAAARKRKAVR